MSVVYCVVFMFVSCWLLVNVKGWWGTAAAVTNPKRSKQASVSVLAVFEEARKFRRRFQLCYSIMTSVAYYDAASYPATHHQ